MQTQVVCMDVWVDGCVGRGLARLVHQMLTVPITIDPEKKPAVRSRPGSILTFLDLTLNQYTIRLALYICASVCSGLVFNRSYVKRSR